jgi:hypothetical protein
MASVVDAGTRVVGEQLLHTVAAAMRTGVFSMSPIAQAQLLGVSEGKRRESGLTDDDLALGLRLLAAGGRPA